MALLRHAGAIIPTRQPRARYQPAFTLTHEEWVNGGSV
jgi:hypothetical protein